MISRNHATPLVASRRFARLAPQEPRGEWIVAL